MYQIQPMPSIVKMLRAAADPTRLRILLLLKAEELSVAELQEILVMGQSTISTHLSQLKHAELVEDRRTGKSSFYSLAPASGDFVDTVLANHCLRQLQNSRSMKVASACVGKCSIGTMRRSNFTKTWERRS